MARESGADPVIEKAFMEAIDRLEAKKPKNESLAIKAKLGRLKINFSTVAVEARRARGLISVEDSAYSRVRARILSFMKATVQGSSPDEENRNLKSRVTELERKLKIATTLNANLFISNGQLQAELKHKSGTLERLRKEMPSEPIASANNKVRHIKS